MSSYAGERDPDSGYDNVALPDREHVRVKKRHHPAKKLRGTKKKTWKYKGFTSRSLTFLALALLQAILISGLMIPIPIVGEFTNDLIIDNNGTVFSDLSCERQRDLVDKVSDGFRPNVSIDEPDGLSQDKEIYVILFLSIAWYNFGLLIYALWTKNILEVGAFILLNLLMTMYSCVQVWQFRELDEKKFLTTAGYLALANTLVLVAMTIIFVFGVRESYFEFGWKIYKKIRRADWRFYYRWYETLMSCAKLNVLFTVIFELGQVTLFLNHCDPEFYFSILIMFAAIGLVIGSYFIVRRESKYLTVGLVIILILQQAYLLFKIVRFSTRSCPLCRLRVVLPFSEREQTFEHLIMLAVVNLILSVVTLLLLLKAWSHYNRELMDQFRSRQSSSGHVTKTLVNMLEETDCHSGRPLSDELKLQPGAADLTEHRLQPVETDQTHNQNHHNPVTGPRPTILNIQM